MWIREEIEQVLIQLDKMNLPFNKYAFSKSGETLQLLGAGGFAMVYEAKLRVKQQPDFAIKVIGFLGKNVDSVDFQKSVNKQQMLSITNHNVVKVYDYTELWVQLGEHNNVVHVEKIADGEDKNVKQNCLKLQFIVMEKVVPVLSRDGAGNPTLMPNALATFEEKEILKLAYDIGGALLDAHNEKLLHRDVKLENIFYQPKGKKYKLGDFGIAKVTDNGIASTTAYTSGYGAPEVRAAFKEKYDNTADIYSFGMLLYVLLNELRFPESENYHVNIQVQYRPGYLLPQPEGVSDELFEIVEKMCRYNPDDRYQSMEEVLNALDSTSIHGVIGLKKEHSMTTLVIGAVLFVIGTIGLKQQLFSHFPVELNVMTYSLIAVLLWKMCLKLQQRDVTLISGLAFVVGVVAVIQNGFTWWKLILLLFITFSQGAIAGVLAIDLLLVNVVYLLTEQSFQFPTIFYDYKWLPALLLSLGAILLLEYIVLDSNDFQLRQMYFKRNYYWTMVYLAYALCILYPLIFSNSNMEYGRAFLEKIVGTTMLQWLISDDILKIGIFGLVFSVFWSVRERMESWRKKSM